MGKIKIFLFISFLYFSFTSFAAVIHVPGEQPTIQAGIDAASDGDIVLVADGTYTGDGNRDLDYGGKAITVKSENGPENCIIDCQGSESDPHRGFYFHNGEGRNAIVQGFTIQNGYANDPYPENFGGAVFCYGSSPSVLDNIITQNFADSTGGGIACREGGSPLIKNNMISGNHAVNFEGGGIYCGRDTSPTIDNNVITDNTTSPSLHATMGGGGIYCWYSTPVIIRNRITENTATAGRGGGISLLYNPSYIVEYNIITGNIAYREGGGICCKSSAGYIANNVITENTTTHLYGDGGGIALIYGSSLISNNIISRNLSEHNGGGLALSGTSVLINNTITDNTTRYGGGIYFGMHYSSDTTIVNTIIWNNNDTQLFMETHSDPSILTISFSDVEGGYDSVIVGSDCTLNWGPGMIDEDPLFLNGPEGGHYLSQIAAGQAEDSPCVDTGDPKSLMIPGTTRTDEVQDAGIVDMGYHYSEYIPHHPWMITGPGPNYTNEPAVRLFYPAGNGAYLYEFSAYGAPHYGVNVSCGDVDGEGLDEILTGPGPGAIYGPHVRGFQVNGLPISGLSFLAYGTKKYGVNVTTGDLDNDGFDEIITGPGPGAVFGPHVRAFNYDGAPPVTPVPGVSYFAYGTRKWGVNVTAGDIDRDGFAEIITGAGPGAIFGPHVRGWNIDNGNATAISAVSYLAYGSKKFGVNVGCGDADGDGFAEILTAPGPSGFFGSHIRGWNYDASTITALPGCSFMAWPASQVRYGANVFSGADLDADGRDELTVGGGPDPSIGSPIKVFHYDGSQVTEWLSLQAFPSDYTHGTTVAAGWF